MCCFSEKHSLEDSSNGRPFDGISERMQLPSVSTALLLAVMIGVFEALALSLGSGLFLNIMGISPVSPYVLILRHLLYLLLCTYICIQVCICVPPPENHNLNARDEYHKGGTCFNART